MREKKNNRLYMYLLCSSAGSQEKTSSVEKQFFENTGKLFKAAGMGFDSRSRSQLWGYRTELNPVIMGLMSE